MLQKAGMASLFTETFFPAGAMQKILREIEGYQEQIKGEAGASVSLTRSLLSQNQQLLLGRIRLLGEMEQQILLVQSNIKANQKLETAVMAQNSEKA